MDMTYSIFDRANLVAAFDSVVEAQQAFDRLAAEPTQPKDSLLLVAFDDDGNAVADCVPGERLLIPAA